MRALTFDQPGGPEVLALTDVPEPAPGLWDLQVRVRAVALNRADLLQLRGLYPPPVGAPEKIPGLEYAGEVEAVGAHVTRFKTGDRVMGLVGGGAFAEVLVTHEREAVRIPERLSFEEGAAIPEAFITAYDALIVQGGLRAGEVALIHAAASGVGTAALQVALVHGALPIGTARTPAKRARLAREFPNALVLDPGFDSASSDAPRFAEQVKSRTGGSGADVALELVGGNYLPETIAAMARQGRVLLVGLLAGAKAELELRAVLTRRLSLIGTVLRSRPAEEKMTAALTLERHLVPLFERGLLRPIVDATFDMKDAARALTRLVDNASYGKILLRW